MTLPSQKIPPLPQPKGLIKLERKKKEYLDELLSKTFKKKYFNQQLLYMEGTNINNRGFIYHSK